MIDERILGYVGKKYALKFNYTQQKDLEDFMIFMNDNVNKTYAGNLKEKSAHMLSRYDDLCVNLMKPHSFNYSHEDFYKNDGFTILNAEDFIIDTDKAAQQKENIMNFLFKRE